MKHITSLRAIRFTGTSPQRHARSRVAALICTLLGAGISAPPTAHAQSGGRLHGPIAILKVPWGRGPEALGRSGGFQSSPQGPMSFALGPRASADDPDAAADALYVLDQTKYRVVRYAGCPHLSPSPDCVTDYPLPADTFQDLEVTADGKLLVLDRLVGTSILVLGIDGESYGEYPILGPGIPAGGGVTAMFARTDGVWLEYAHRYVVRVLDETYRPCRHEIVSGRLHASAPVSLGAVLDGGGGAEVWLTDLASGLIFEATGLYFAHDIARIIWLEADRQGRVYALLHLLEYDPIDLGRVVYERNMGIVMDHTLTEIDAFASPYVINSWEQFREFRITPDGRIHQMAFGPDGVYFLVWRRR